MALLKVEAWIHFRQLVGGKVMIPSYRCLQAVIDNLTLIHDVIVIDLKHRFMEAWLELDESFKQLIKSVASLPCHERISLIEKYVCSIDFLFHNLNVCNDSFKVFLWFFPRFSIEYSLRYFDSVSPICCELIHRRYGKRRLAFFSVAITIDSYLIELVRELITALVLF